MTHFLLFSGIVIILCLFMNRFTDKIPVPSLIFFLSPVWCLLCFTADSAPILRLRALSLRLLFCFPPLVSY